MYSTLMAELKDSAAALSNAEPTRPIDCSTPKRRQALSYACEVYSLPRSESKITPSTVPPRVAAAIRSDAITRSASGCPAHRVAEQPAREQIDHRRQIKLPVVGDDLGHVAAPQHVRCGYAELAVDRSGATGRLPCLVPKAGGRGVRVLGVPTVDDRIAQTVAAMYL